MSLKLPFSEIIKEKKITIIESNKETNKELFKIFNEVIEEGFF
jgi:hypothetical protein